MNSWSYPLRAVIGALIAGFLLVLAPVQATSTIIVDSDCSLANAIRSANGEAQIEDVDDADGNNKCEAGTAPDATLDPIETGEDTIQLSRNITLTAALPTITSHITIDGNNKFISGDDTYPVLLILSGDVTIIDLTIKNGANGTFGGAIYVNDGGLSIENSTIINNTAGDIGGGIYSAGSNVTVTDSDFENNKTIQSHGGGIYFGSIDSRHTLDIYNSTFTNNSSEEDGGAVKIAGGVVTIEKSTFVGNAADEGGAIESSNATLTIVNSTMARNTAREGGGLSSFGSDVTLTHTTWAENEASEQGGGIAIIGWSGSFKIRNTLVTNSVNGGDCDPGPNEYIIIEFTGNLIQDGSCEPPPANDSQAVEGEEAQAQADDKIVEDAEVVDEDFEAQHDDHEDEDPEDLDDTGIDDTLKGDPPYYPLEWGSDAIDGGDPVYCEDDDQPGTERPQYDNCDIGAYEYPKPPETTPTPEPPPPPTATPPPVPTPTLVPLDVPLEEPDVCIPNEYMAVESLSVGVDCEPVDLLTLDKHPSLVGARFAMRVWAGNAVCAHEVAEGENLYRLAIQYQTGVDALRRHNNLQGNQLQVGQVLLLPNCVEQVFAQAANTRVCFRGQGDIALIDSAQEPPEVILLDTHESESVTCAVVDRPGTVLFLVVQS